MLPAVISQTTINLRHALPPPGDIQQQAREQATVRRHDRGAMNRRSPMKKRKSRTIHRDDLQGRGRSSSSECCCAEVRALEAARAEGLTATFRHFSMSSRNFKSASTDIDATLALAIATSGKRTIHIANPRNKQTSSPTPSGLLVVNPPSRQATPSHVAPAAVRRIASASPNLTVPLRNPLEQRERLLGKALNRI